MDLFTYMGQEKPVSRWFILRVAMLGAFAGVLLATVYYMYFMAI